MFMVDAMQVDGQFAVFALLITTGFSTIFQYFSIMRAYKIGSFY